MQMAAEIEELDVVVGGHSHTFLWPGKLTSALSIIYVTALLFQTSNKVKHFIYKKENSEITHNI